MEKGPCGALDPKMEPDYPTSRFFLTCVLGYGVGGGRISVRKVHAWGILEKAHFKIGKSILGVDIVPGRFWGVGGVFLGSRWLKLSKNTFVLRYERVF